MNGPFFIFKNAFAGPYNYCLADSDVCTALSGGGKKTVIVLELNKWKPLKLIHHRCMYHGLNAPYQKAEELYNMPFVLI